MTLALASLSPLKEEGTRANLGGKANLSNPCIFAGLIGAQIEHYPKTKISGKTLLPKLLHK